ncbi:glycoside hydrolase family 3 C-terminal domain-containing protein [uncultured Sphaerochaeta sp.]|uniref:glycoside hydrolase family 3 protein n=1 Tax=uncultured Sphaerochaeta sp. TaxID=886478 RepID=UPI002A0A7703|nr:glycoside hydrolase family 3 C-terminal domain-containing protein [uncultured Sphaerochaeta sp.]
MVGYRSASENPVCTRIVVCPLIAGSEENFLCILLPVLGFGALEKAQKKGYAISYSQGFFSLEDVYDPVLAKQAVEVAKSADKVVIFAGLPDSFESEGYDRTHMDLPHCQNRVIEEIVKVQPNCIVVLHNGSPVTMPWVDKVSSIVEVYLGGEGIGEATVDILYGKANPGGKLAETFPVRLEDTPSYLTFPGRRQKVHYSEGVFVGYRYYDTKKLEVLFPSGHGLSYTTFVLSNLRLDRDSLTSDKILTL